MLISFYKMVINFVQLLWNIGWLGKCIGATDFPIRPNKRVALWNRFQIFLCVFCLNNFGIGVNQKRTQNIFFNHSLNKQNPLASVWWNYLFILYISMFVIICDMLGELFVISVYWSWWRAGNWRLILILGLKSWH